MSLLIATGVACPNIAFIKYWGNIDHHQRIPSNGSISMNLGGLYSRTRVTFSLEFGIDQFILNQQPMVGVPLQRVSTHLDKVRRLTGIQLFARVESQNNFPTGSGLASSASGFAALTLAACKAAGLKLDEPDLSRLARSASGSACRSVPGGFVEWQVGEDDQTSFAYSLASPDHWDLVDCVAVVSQVHKPISSQEGHLLAGSSPFQAARLADAPHRLEICRRAIMERDFEALVDVVELDSNLMHSVMMTSSPPLFYWQPTTLEVMRAVSDWRREGLPVCYTVDAGPNVHVISLSSWASQITERLNQIPGISKVITANPGGPAYCLPDVESSDP